MVTLKINDTKYRVPSHFTIEEWKKFHSWDFNDPAYHALIVHQATGAPLETLREADEESLMLGVGFIVGMLNNREKISIPDFNTFNFGQFVDLDCFISLGTEKYIDKMLEVMKVETDKASEALWVIEQYIMWRNNIYYQFRGLFGIDDKEFDAFVDGYEGPEDPMQIARGWYKIIVDLANDDLLKIDEVTEQPLKKVLTFMNHRKEQAIKAAEEARQMRNKQLAK